jgi:hypothetical protein
MYDARDGITVDQLGLTTPYLVRNLVPDWPAFTRWQKDELLNRYGERVVRSGSESSIVHSGGVAEQESTLAYMVEHMSMDETDLGKSFIFDTTILRVIPELNDDFSVPQIFQSWDNAANETKSALWHMLSLGPSKSGIYFIACTDLYLCADCALVCLLRIVFSQPRQDLARSGARD